MKHMKRLYIEKAMEWFLKQEIDEYAERMYRHVLATSDEPDEVMGFYRSWLTASQMLRDNGTQVFVFDRDAQREIESTDGELEPKEIYQAFPYDAAYMKIEHPIIDGFVVAKDHEAQTILFLELVRRDYEDEHIPEGSRKMLDIPFGEIGFKEICNLTSYVAAKNADLNLVYKPPSKKALSNHKKRRSAATITQVGFHIGSQLREYRRSVKSSGHDGGTVRPHIRRAHWHRFWTGPMDGERKLVLKWLQPVFVNPEKGEMEPTVHEVRKEVRE